jgi:hypothetical protein
MNNGAASSVGLRCVSELKSRGDPASFGVNLDFRAKTGNSTLAFVMSFHGKILHEFPSAILNVWNLGPQPHGSWGLLL